MSKDKWVRKSKKVALERFGGDDMDDDLHIKRLIWFELEKKRLEEEARRRENMYLFLFTLVGFVFGLSIGIFLM